MALATAEAIRDRILTLLESLTPTSLSGDKFRRYRNEGDGDFEAWAEKNPAAAFRRVQCRQTGGDSRPEISNTTEERIRTRFEVRVAYPQNHRYGAGNALDRDDVMNQDWLKINYAIGEYGRGNFSGTNDCTPTAAADNELERVGKIDYLVVRVEYEYVRSCT